MSDDVWRVSLVYPIEDCGWHRDGPITANKVFPHLDGSHALIPWEQYGRLRAKLASVEGTLSAEKIICEARKIQVGNLREELAEARVRISELERDLWNVLDEDAVRLGEEADDD